MALRPDALGIHGFVVLEIIQRAARAPVVRLPWLAFVDQADDAFREPGPVIGLDTRRHQLRVTPAPRKNLLLPGWPGRRWRSRKSRWNTKTSAEFHDHRNWAVGIGRRRKSQLDIDSYLRIGRVVDVTD